MKGKREKLMILALVFTMGLAVSMTNADLVAHWGLDGNANDSLGRNNGTLGGSPQWVTGKVGGALEFDGLDDFIDFDAKIVEGSFSFALWFQHHAADDFRPVMRNDTQDPGWVRINLTNSRKFRLNIHNANNPRSPKRIASNTVLAKNQWYHLVATYDTSTGVASIYVDGLLDREIKSFGVDTPHIGPLEIGRGPKRHFDGVLDDIRIFDHTLDADDVAILYSRYFPQASRTLLSLLRAAREAKAMMEEKDPHEVIAFLEKKISEYERLKEKNSDDVGLPSESLYSDMHFLLAKAKEAAGIPKNNVIAAYKQSVLRPAYRPNYVPALLWLFGNIPADDYVEVVKKCVHNNNSIIDHIRRVVNDFESSENWTAFELFLDAGFSEVDVNDTVSYAMVTAEALKNNREWSSKFSGYCQSKPELRQYVLGTLEKQAQRSVENNKFRKAAEIYQDILNQCGPDQDKTLYEFKVCKCLFSSGQYTSALSALSNFVKNNKATNRTLARQAILLKGRAHMQLGEMDRASDTFLELMIDYPEAKRTPEANFFVGYCSMLQGGLEEAAEALSLVVKDYPESSYASKARLCLARIERMTE